MHMIGSRGHARALTSIVINLHTDCLKTGFSRASFSSRRQRGVGREGVGLPLRELRSCKQSSAVRERGCSWHFRSNRWKELRHRIWSTPCLNFKLDTFGWPRRVTLRSTCTCR